ncbi:hypothetical protein [Anaerolentibacter hominis]|uniref:hypothetical protein n=1 Tax=Anaerolentibacter hominis TaxID=3079009 RepID=UPI0031B897AE
MTDHEIMQTMQGMFEPVHRQLADMDSRIENLQSDIDKLKLQNENIIIPALQILAENYMPAAVAYEKDTSRIGILERRMDTVETVVEEHSKVLNTIA